MKNRHLPLYLALALAGTPCINAATLSLSATDGAYIRASQSGTGGNSLIIVGDTTTANDYLRGALAFDLSSPLLAGATINSVTLTLTIASDDSGTSANLIDTVNLHQLSASFTNDDVSWTSRNGTDTWATPGGDFGGVLDSADGNSSLVDTGDLFNFSGASLTSAGEGAVGGSLYLIAALATEDATRSVFRFAAENNPDEALRPVLTIDYTAVPEPSGALLMGLAGLLGVLRRRR